MKVKNLGKRDWYNSVKTRESTVQVNLLNLDEKDWQFKPYIKKKKKCKRILANLHQYEKEKHASESVE